MVFNSGIKDTMIFQFAKELNSQKTIEGHEEKEEEGHVIYLLARAPRKVT